MPVRTVIPIRHFSQEDFGDVAYEVVGHAFGVHSTLGRIFHEPIYRSTMHRVIGERSIEKFSIQVSHQGWQKTLYVDFLVDAGCPFELKVVSDLTDAHASQLIQYLMLLGLSHGKLINFGKELVEHQFVNCHETLEQRRQFRIEQVNWIKDEHANRFEHVVVSLLRDLGTGLSRTLYEEACTFLLCGPTPEREFTDAFWRGNRTGRQAVQMIGKGIVFKLTCKREELHIYESHLKRFLANTDLKCILWANIELGRLRLQRIARS